MRHKLCFGTPEMVSILERDQSPMVQNGIAEIWSFQDEGKGRDTTRTFLSLEDRPWSTWGRPGVDPGSTRSRPGSTRGRPGRVDPGSTRGRPGVDPRVDPGSTRGRPRSTRGRPGVDPEILECFIFFCISQLSLYGSLSPKGSSLQRTLVFRFSTCF